MQTKALTKKRDTGYTDSYTDTVSTSPPPPPSVLAGTTSAEIDSAENKTTSAVSTHTPIILDAVVAVAGAEASAAAVIDKSTVAVANNNTHGDFFFVHCDLIEPRYIGDQLARIVRILPTCDQNHVTFRQIEYCELERVYFDSISILLADSSAMPIKFQMNVNISGSHQ